MGPIFCKGLFSMCHHVCNLIAQDILLKAQETEGTDSPDSWAKVQEYWPKFQEFLRLLGEQEIEDKTIKLMIHSICALGKSSFFFPDLANLGRVAFRAQVLPFHHRESPDRPLVCCVNAVDPIATG